MGTIKLSPTYQPVLPLESAGRAGAPPPGGPKAPPAARKQAWLLAEGLSQVPEKLGAARPAAASRALQRLVAQ